MDKLKNKQVVIVEVPTNLGLKVSSEDTEPGVKYLPDWLRKHGFFDGFEERQTYKIHPAGYTMLLDQISGVRNADNIVDCALKQQELLTPLLKDEYFPLVVGGDCSMLIGNGLAFKSIGKYALFFLDGHTDFITPEQSQTKAAAGMDLAIVTGTGHDKLTNINGLKPYFQEKHVWCSGNREFINDYDALIKNSLINYYPLTTLRNDIGACVANFLRMVESENLDGFFIHLDVDVLDDNLMPAVDSRNPGGLLYEELNKILVPLLRSDLAKGLEIGILDPELDPAALYTKPFVLQLKRIFADADCMY